MDLFNALNTYSEIRDDKTENAVLLRFIIMETFAIAQFVLQLFLKMITDNYCANYRLLVTFGAFEVQKHTFLSINAARKSVG